MAKRTKLQDKIIDKLADPTSKGQLSTTKSSDVAQKKNLPGWQASASETRSIRPQFNARAADYLSRIPHAEDDVEVEDVGFIPTTPENLPAVISRAVGPHGIQPKWHMVKHLPGYMSSAIRALGRQTFARFTRTPIEEIQVLSSLSNTETELRLMGDWIRHNGVKDSAMTMDFEHMFPGYEANINVWHTEGYTFVVMVDFAGKYIYGWPDAHNIRKRLT